jgi:DNA-binding MarR family transcriptional regulator
MDQRTRSKKVRPRKRSSDRAPADEPSLLTLEEFLPWRLNTLAASVSSSLTPIYRDKYGFGQAEWRTIMTLGQYGVMTPKKLGQHSGMLKAKVTRGIAALEYKGLISRQSNRDDLRKAFLALTPAGRAIYAILAQQAIAYNKRIYGQIDPADRAALERIYASLMKFSHVAAAEATTVRAQLSQNKIATAIKGAAKTSRGSSS